MFDPCPGLRNRFSDIRVRFGGINCVSLTLYFGDEALGTLNDQNKMKVRAKFKDIDKINKLSVRLKRKSFLSNDQNNVLKTLRGTSLVNRKRENTFSRMRKCYAQSRMRSGLFYTFSSVEKTPEEIKQITALEVVCARGIVHSH